MRSLNGDEHIAPVTVDIDTIPTLPKGIVPGESMNMLKMARISKGGEITNNDEKGMSTCFDDTDCDKGHRCSKETYSCEYIQECDIVSGRVHGLKHGDCIPCTSDMECGWQPEMTLEGSEIPVRMDHCWPDGGCRQAPPFKINTFKVARNTSQISEYSVIPAKKFSKGERMCMTVSPTLEKQAEWMAIDIMKLEMCASNLYFSGKNSHVNPHHDVEKSSPAVHPYQRTPDYRYPGIVHYDPDNPSSSGCRSDSNRVRRYTVFTKSDNDKADMTDHTYHHRKEFFSLSVDKHHFHPSTEISTVTKGGDTVCFDAIPITAEDVPVYTEITVRVSPVPNDSKGGDSNDTISDQEKDRLLVEMLYGMHNEEGTKPSQWEGVVASRKFKVPEKRDESVDYYSLTSSVSSSDDDDDGGVFVNCGGGTKFNGVAGLCEAPSIANEVFFWVLIGNTLVIIVGAVLFVLALKQHNDDMLYLVRNGFIDS